MPALDHVIATRFSVTFTPEQPPPADDWLRYRLGFFREATKASLASQSEPRFRWLVFLDHRAPEWLRDEMRELARDLFEPVFVTGPFGPFALRTAIGSESSLPLLTTRLDSDDALGVRFVETIQREASAALDAGLGPDGLFLNATRGLQLDRSGRVYRFDYPSNPFLSFVETRTAGVAPRTVLQDGRHGAAREHAPVRSIRAEPLWLQVVHGANLMNDIRGVRVDPDHVARSFAIDLDYTTSVNRLRLAVETGRSLLQLARLWLRRPGLARFFVLGRIEYLRGSRTAPRRRPPARR